MDLTAEQIARFWARVDQSGGPDACWPWLGCVNPSGLGVVHFNGQRHYTHRVSYTLTYGPPSAPCVYHATCHTLHCGNPAHLATGTQVDRAAHMHAARGLRLIGPRKLNASEVAMIRHAVNAGTPIKTLATRYRVSTATIGDVIHGKTWPEIEGPRHYTVAIAPEWITALRQARGWTQAELARRADLTPPQLCRLERGTARSGLLINQRLARAFGLTLDQLFLA